MLELFFPYSEHTVFFVAIGLALFLLYSRDGRIPTWYHADLAMILAWVPLPDYEVGDLKVTMLLGWFPLFYWIPRLIVLFRREPEPSAVPRLPERSLKLLAGVAVAYLVLLALVSPYPFGKVGDFDYHLSDSAVIGYMGANRMLDGELPYEEGQADWGRVYPYGPAYYALYVPIAYVFPERDMQYAYCLGARLFGILLALIGAAGLFSLGRQLAGSVAGWGWALFWLACPYVHNSVYWAQASHLLPGALTAVGFAALVRRPLIAGGVLGLAAGAAHYPAMFLPVWAKATGRMRRFVVGFIAVLVASFLPVIFAHHGWARFFNHVVWMEGSMFGSPVADEWSPWAQYPPLLFARYGLMLLYPGLVAYVVVRCLREGASVRKAAIGSAILIAGFQIWKEHAPGRYHLWLFPLLILSCLWPERREPDSTPPTVAVDAGSTQ